MEYPSDLLYTKEHEWVRIEGNMATVGVTAFAAGELGDIVYIDISTLGADLEEHEIFGTIEAVKTVSDLFMPVSGTIKEVNAALNDAPELVNNDPYGKGWMVKVAVSGTTDGLMNVDDYRKMIGL